MLTHGLNVALNHGLNVKVDCEALMYKHEHIGVWADYSVQCV